VISSQEEEIFWVFDFIGEEETDGFEGLFATINVISKEEVIRIRRIAAIVKQTEKIIVLAMDIT
jgi:hypothetical protein